MKIDEFQIQSDIAVGEGTVFIGKKDLFVLKGSFPNARDALGRRILRRIIDAGSIGISDAQLVRELDTSQGQLQKFWTDIKQKVNEIGGSVNATGQAWGVKISGLNGGTLSILRDVRKGKSSNRFESRSFITMATPYVLSPSVASDEFLNSKRAELDNLLLATEDDGESVRQWWRKEYLQLWQRTDAEAILFVQEVCSRLEDQLRVSDRFTVALALSSVGSYDLSNTFAMKAFREVENTIDGEFYRPIFTAISIANEAKLVRRTEAITEDDLTELIDRSTEVMSDLVQIMKILGQTNDSPEMFAAYVQLGKSLGRFLAQRLDVRGASILNDICTTLKDFNFNEFILGLRVDAEIHLAECSAWRPASRASIGYRSEIEESLLRCKGAQQLLIKAFDGGVNSRGFALKTVETRLLWAKLVAGIVLGIPTALREFDQVIESAQYAYYLSIQIYGSGSYNVYIAYFWVARCFHEKFVFEMSLGGSETDQREANRVIETAITLCEEQQLSNLDSTLPAMLDLDLQSYRSWLNQYSAEEPPCYSWGLKVSLL